MKNVIKVLVFIILVVVIIYKLGTVFTPRYATYDIIPGYNNLPKNSLDALFIGDSDVYSDISPMEMFEKYGYTSYNYASPAASNMLMYYMLKEALKTQTPKVVIMDGTTIFGNYESDGMRRQATDLMPLDDVKWDLLNDSAYNFSLRKKVSLIFPFFRYHDRWNKINGSDFTKLKSSDSYGKGYIFLSDKKKTQYNDGYMKKDSESIDFKNSNQPDSVIKAKELCDSKGIKFLFVTLPDATSWSYEKYEKLKSWTSDNNIDYLDYNVLINDINLDFSTDSVDNGMHLNISGAIKVSNYMGNYLVNNYGLTSHKDDDNSENFRNDLAKYNDTRDSYLKNLVNNN